MVHRSPLYIMEKCCIEEREMNKILILCFCLTREPSRALGLISVVRSMARDRVISQRPSRLVSHIVAQS